jgi:rare lipoprotein A
MKYTFIASYVKVLAVAVCCLFFLTTEIFSQHTAGKKSSVERVFYGQASFYANKFAGRKTASGEIFSQTKMTCACNAVKLGTWLRVTHVRTKKSVLVKVNDRIHPKMKRVVDLSSGAARKIGITSSNGVGRVKVEVLGTIKPAE